MAGAGDMLAIAGLGLAQDDERWMWPEYARLVSELRPAWVVIENVPGLRHRGLRTVLADLAALGFDAEWDHISAASVGAPHIRDRIIVVAHAQSQPVRRGLRPRRTGWERRGRPGDSSSPRGDKQATGREEQRWPGAILPPLRDAERTGWWESEPDVGRVADGVPRRVDRLTALGNAVVPQVAEHVGRRVMRAIEQLEDAA